MPIHKADRRYFPLYRDTKQEPWGIISNVKTEYGSKVITISGVLKVSRIVFRIMKLSLLTKISKILIVVKAETNARITDDSIFRFKIISRQQSTYFEYAMEYFMTSDKLHLVLRSMYLYTHCTPYIKNYIFQLLVIRHRSKESTGRIVQVISSIQNICNVILWRHSNHFI